MYLILLLFLQLQMSDTSQELDDARNNFLQVSNLESAESKGDLWLESENSTLQGYGACMYFMQAKFAKNPITKWGRFKKGKKKLDGLIDADSENVELRYLRFLFQNEMPEFLGYHQNREQDFSLIVASIDTANLLEDLKCIILKNISEVKDLASEKKLQIDKKMKKCS